VFDPDALPLLRDVISRHDLRAEKKLGQNFILDRNVTDKIVRAAGDLSGTTVFEIGPGPGGLTRSILGAGAERVIAVEFDPRAVAALQELAVVADGRLKIVHADALQTDLPALTPGERRAVIANLPYNIATPLLLHWLEQIHADSNAFSFLLLMFQKEVALRLTAPPGRKDYGRLAIMTQWLCRARRCFDLPPSVFVPAPKITSSIVYLEPLPLAASKPSFKTMETLTAAGFGQRRKMIRTSMKDYLSILKELNIDEKLRAEQLTVDDFIRIATAIDS
jgi:16S rRNA (adenine1518-N6/adenine1519-N6)-dimethyltransferase